MRSLGIRGVVRGKKVITTNPDTSLPCPDDKVNRLFMADRPNMLWGEPWSAIGLRTMASDFTYVPTWSGTVYVAFVIDVFARRIVGWRASTSMKTQFVLDALDQAIWQIKAPDNKGLVHHSDRGSQYLSIKYTERLAEAEIDLSVGTVGDAYDNALAECVIGLFKTEVINQIGPWKSMRELERETLKWVDWYNNRRLLGPIGYIPPAEAEEAYDTRKCHDAIAERSAQAVIPPRKNAKPWKAVAAGAVARNEALRASKYLGRALWRR